METFFCTVADEDDCELDEYEKIAQQVSRAIGAGDTGRGAVEVQGVSRETDGYVYVNLMIRCPVRPPDGWPGQ